MNNYKNRSHSFLNEIATLGSDATILRVEICDKTVIGAGAVVSKIL